MMIRGAKSQTLHGARNLDEYVRSQFAKAMLAQKIWMKGEGVKFTVKAK